MSQIKRAGRIAIVGKPNVGKSTLLNALVGQKISISSRKAQTTRHRIMGVLTRGETQFVFIDTPGFQTRHSGALNKSLNRAVSSALSEVQLVLVVVEAGSFREGDHQVMEMLANRDQAPDTTTILIANKVDTVRDRAVLAQWLEETHRWGQESGLFSQVFPMSARKAKDIERLKDLLEQHLPVQEWLYAREVLTDRSEQFLAGEIIREKLFRLTGDELPYASTVCIEEFAQEPLVKARQKWLKRISASIIVEREAHKGMIVGRGGERLKRIGTEARVELERLWDAKVFLQLWVKVKSGWADEAARLRSYGYE